MRFVTTLLSITFISFNSFAADKLVKTFDGHRVLCQNSKDVENLAKSKSVGVKLLSDHAIQIKLLKCTNTGWAQDPQPQIERVDEPAIVSYPIYQFFHAYTLYVLKDQKIILQKDLLSLLATGEETVEVENWDPNSEIYIGTLTETKDGQGRVIDENHYDSFGTFNLYKD